MFKKLLILSILFTATFVIGGSRAEAQAVQTGASGTPSSPRATCGPGQPVDFAVIVRNVSLDTVSGRINFQVVPAWKTCYSSSETRAYAIYANPDICPVSGWYGLNGTANDCVKYVGSPPGYVGPGNGLSCYGGTQTNEQCVQNNFAGVRVFEQEPPLAGRVQPINMSYTIPGWSSARNTPNSHTAGSRMCQFYKFGAPNFTSSVPNSDPRSRCVDVSVTVSWDVLLSDSGTCSFTIAGGNVFNPGQTKRVDYTTRNTGQQTWGMNAFLGNNRYRLVDRNPTAPWTDSPAAPREIEITGSGVENNPTFGPILRPGIATSWRQDLSIPSTLPPGAYQFDWQVYGSSPSLGLHYVSGTRCTMNIIVEEPIRKPYFKVYNGDVIVGSGFTNSGGSCSFNNGSDDITGANIRAYGSGTGNRFRGSSVEFGAHALGVIKNGFYSANKTSNQPLGLTFGNYIAGTGLVGLQEGGFDTSGAAERCIADYYKYFSDKYPSTDPANANNYFAGGGNLSTKLASMPANRILLVDGNLNIDVSLPSLAPPPGGWTEPDDVRPNIIIVKGDITIASGVNQIDGLIVAQPDDAGNKGEINTCVPLDAGCGTNQLTVNGAFIAKKVFLNRLFGDTSTAQPGDESVSSNSAGEIFNFTYELYFPFLDDDTDEGGDDAPVDGIVGLPPVL